MGIRKGWALCGAGEQRCFISHAVSSHPLLELQTLGLSTLSSPHHQDLPLDSIQRNSHLPSVPPPLCFYSFSFPITSPATCHPHPHRFSADGKLVGGLFHLSFPSLYLKMKREKADLIWRHSWSESTPLFPAYFLFFCSPALPPDCLSVDIIPVSAHANDMGGREGVGGLRLDSSSPPPPPPRLLLLLLFPGWSRSGLASRSTLRNHEHGASLGKQRPGQQGFTQTLIILRAISGGSPQLYTCLYLLSLIVQSPL